MVTPVSPEHPGSSGPLTIEEKVHLLERLLRAPESEPDWNLEIPSFNLVHENHAGQNDSIEDFATHLLERPLPHGENLCRNIGVSLQMLVESRLRAHVQHESKRKTSSNNNDSKSKVHLDRLMEQECVVRDISVSFQPTAVNEQVLLKVEGTALLAHSKQEVSLRVLGKVEVEHESVRFTLDMHPVLHQLMKAAYRLVDKAVTQPLSTNLDMLSAVAQVSPTLTSMPPPPPRIMVDDTLSLSIEACEHIVDDIFDDIDFPTTKKQKTQ